VDDGVGRLARYDDERTALLSTTSAARSTSERVVPCAMLASVPIEHGQIAMPREGADPDAGVAPRSASA